MHKKAADRHCCDSFFHLVNGFYCDLKRQDENEGQGKVVSKLSMRYYGPFQFWNSWEIIPMPILEGVGDELLYAALFAAPIVLIFRSSLGSVALEVLRNGLFTVGSWLTQVWNTMWSRGTSTSTGVSDGNGGFLASMVVPPQNDCCSICHDTFTFPCQANCAHWFCGDCILRVWQHTSALQPCRCPICRRTINLLIPSHFEQSEDPEAQRVLHDVANYNRYFGGGPVSIIQRVRDMPLLLRRLMQDLMDPQRALPLVHRTRIIIYLMLMTFYVFSPLDILPEGKSVSVSRF
ncbi:hypothetical protein L7F22_038182 [Adiantum nelumboides]|nr:hypothetical protein [Adiantum nelumboides]